MGLRPSLAWRRAGDGGADGRGRGASTRCGTGIGRAQPVQPAGSIYDPELPEFTRVNTNVFTVSNLFVLSGLVGHITWMLETGMARRAGGVVWRA